MAWQALVGSSAASAQEVNPERDASAVLQAIPAANLFKYSKPPIFVFDARSWQNPYLVVCTDQVEVLGRVNHKRRIVKPSQVLDALAHMPRSAWPEGRIVAFALQEDASTVSEKDFAAIRRSSSLVTTELMVAGVMFASVPNY